MMDLQLYRCCNGLYYWKIRDYSRLRRSASAGELPVLHRCVYNECLRQNYFCIVLEFTSNNNYSPGFYTSPQGYRICIRVNLDGVESAQGTHLSLFVHLMKGENDELLNWPFAGVITLTVVNQVPELHTIDVLFISYGW